MLALLLALQLTPDSATALRYHYRITTRSTVDPGTGMAPLVMTMSAFVAVTLHDSAAGRVANIRIYSNAFDGGAMSTSLPAQLSEDPRDVTLHGYFVDGRAVSLTTSTENLRAMRLIPAIELAMATSRTVRPGDIWSDTTATDTSITSASSKARVVSRWSATRRSPGELEFHATMAGTSIHQAGAMQLTLQTTGTRRLTANDGQPATTATATTSGQGKLQAGAGSLPMTVRTDLSATLFQTAIWSQIP